MKHFSSFNRYLSLFAIIASGFFILSREVSADLGSKFRSGEASLSSISHGSTYKPGDPITFAGYVIDKFPPGGTYETVACQIAVGFEKSWYSNGSNPKIRYHLGVILADFVYHSDGKRYCEFNETFTVPNIPATEDNKFSAIVYPIYGVSSGGSEPNFWNYGSFWEHIYINTSSGGPEVYIKLNYHEDMCLGVSGTVITNYVKPNTRPCTFTSNPSNSDWNSIILNSNSVGNGSESFNISGATFDRNGRLVLNVSCVDAAGKTGRASAVAFEQNCVCGIKPMNTDWHAGDTQDLSQSMSSTYSATDTERQCEYKCKNGYTWNGSVCANTPTPVPNLKINNSDGPLTVNKGDNLNLTWPSVANATSCTGTGTGWTGAKSISGGNESIVATTLGSTSYTLTCTGPGGTGADSVAVTVVLPKYYTLSVTKSGVARNLSTVTGTGINCGSDCKKTLDSGTPITLTAAAGTNAVFEGWSGGTCTGKGNCSFILDKDTTVTASFACKEYYELSGEVCVAVPGKCGTALESCYTSIPAKDILCAEGDPDPYPPTYFAGKWTWTCKGIPDSGQCSVNQCAIYKEVAP